MKDKPHQRRSIRLQDYDYAQNGAYTVTICTHQREYLFGEIVDGEMVSNTFGQIVEEEWLRTAELRSYVVLDEYVVMPNHFHGILFILHDDSTADIVGARRALPLQPQPNVLLGKNKNRAPQFGKPISKSLGTIVGSFKSAVTKLINERRGTPNAPVWQRNYYEQIIRNGTTLDTFRQYIQTNPGQWADDRENPVNISRN